MAGYVLTDATGRSFLSYRRKRLEEARLLIAAQHDLGVPTWQDIQNLDEEPTEEAIRRVLEDPLTANAILWLTPEVEHSSVIRRVEVPLILARAERADDFFCVPVAAGGLDYDQATAVVGGQLSTADLREWNIRKVDADPIGPGEAAEIAQRIVRRRLSATHNRLDLGAPLRLTLDTWVTPAFEPGVAVAMDWSHRFDGRSPKVGAWEHHLVPALKTVVAAIEEKAPGRRVEARGRLTISAAVALGAAFLAPRRLSLGWWQHTPGFPEQLWSLDLPREASGIVADTKASMSDGDDLAVLVSVADDVDPAFGATRAESPSPLPPFRAIIRVCQPNEPPPYHIASAGQAVDIAFVVAEGIRAARRDFRPRGRIHLFMAVPVGLAVLIGQLLNTLGQIQTYEYDPNSVVGLYRPAATICPIV